MHDNTSFEQYTTFLVVHFVKYTLTEIMGKHIFLCMICVLCVYDETINVFAVYYETLFRGIVP